MCGGQKTKLEIAIQIYNLIVSGKSILVLDEPEQNFQENVFEALLNIVNLSNDKDPILDKYNFNRNFVLIVVTHVRFVPEELKYWNAILNFEHGLIKRIK